MDRDEAREVLAAVVDVEAMKHARGSFGPRTCVGEHTIDALFGASLTEARAAMEELDPLPSQAEIQECQSLAISGMAKTASEFCCTAEEKARAIIEIDRVKAVFDAFHRAAPRQKEKG